MNAATFPDVTWTTTTYAPAGYIEVPYDVTGGQAKALSEAWAEAQKDPSKPFILSGGARFVPFDAYQQQAIEVDPFGLPNKLLAVGLVANAILSVALVVAVVLGQ